MPLICIASPKGGVGKTSVAAGLSDALRRAGRTVVAIDCDPQNALRLHLGLPITEVEGYLARLPERPDWRRFLRQTPAGIDLLPPWAAALHGRARRPAARPAIRAATRTMARTVRWAMAG